MTTLSVDSLVALGFVLGLRHAIEADHLAAISTIVTERRSLLSSLLVGASWGLGHTLALLLAGVGVLLLRYQMTDRMAHALELCVGMMLVLLGANVLRTLAHRGATHGHDHATVASQSHSEAWLVARPLLVGMVHGLAGSAPLLLLTVAVVSSPWAAFLYIAVFGVGSMMGGDHELAAQCARSPHSGALRAHQPGGARSLWVVQHRTWPLHRVRERRAESAVRVMEGPDEGSTPSCNSVACRTLISRRGTPYD
jgi:hypothetical protein